MNTNDLPPAAKLAALIEAGRAANPDLKHGRWAMLRGGEACAIGFAALACGARRDALGSDLPGVRTEEAFRVLGPLHAGRLSCLVQEMNDKARATIDEIILSLREGELAKVPA